MNSHDSLNLIECFLCSHAFAFEGVLQPRIAVIRDPELVLALAATPRTRLPWVALEHAKCLLLIALCLVVEDLIDLVIQCTIFLFDFSHL